jgi:tripartite ATP-independent transporter DctM subunit
MLGGVLVGVLSGFYLGAVVGGVALIIGILTLGDATFQIMYLRLYDMSTNYALAAVPLFVFMGAMLERSGIADMIYHALYLWLGRLRGGLAVTTVVLGVIVAACVGVIAASVSMLTLVALPAMIKRGYDKSLAAGTCAAAGTLGILIPPSIMLVIYGPMALVSVGRLFMGAFLPGFLLAFLYIVYISVRCFFHAETGPAVPIEQRAMPFTKKSILLLRALVPPSIVILSVLGSIFFGVAAPTEAAAVGAFTATMLAVVYRKFSWRVLRETSLLTLKVSTIGFFIAATSYAFVGVFLALGCGDVLMNLIMSAPGGRWGAFIMVMFVMFILGMFIDWLGIVFIMVPIIAPAAIALGFDPVWFGIMVCVNLQMAFNTPPLAQAIFFVKGSADPALGVEMNDIIKGVLPFVALIAIGLVICAVFPQIITWLPSLMIR